VRKLANLLIARSDARSRETAIRLSIGCGPMRLIRQFMTEALVLAALGCTLGLVLARWGADLLIAMASRPEDPYRLNVDPDLRVLLFSCGVTLASTLIFGLLPAWRASAVDVQTGLKTTARHHNLVPRFLLGRGLVALQVGISTVLLFGAGLFIRTLVHLRTLDAGFARSGTVQLRIDTQASGFGNDKLPAFYGRALERARQLPGVQSASFAFKGMIGSSRSRTCCLAAEGRPRPAAQYRRVNMEEIMPEYLARWACGSSRGVASEMMQAKMDWSRSSSTKLSLYGSSKTSTSLEGASAGVTKARRSNSIWRSSASWRMPSTWTCARRLSRFCIFPQTAKIIFELSCSALRPIPGVPAKRCGERSSNSSRGSTSQNRRRSPRRSTGFSSPSGSSPN
jgi:hypothetical protein